MQYIINNAYYLWSRWIESLKVDSQRKLTSRLQNGSMLMENRLQQSLQRGAVRIRTDAAFQQTTKQGAATAVVYNLDGSIHQCAYRRFKAESALQAELQGADLALKLAWKLNLRKILIESDCKLMVDALEEDGGTIDWSCFTIFSDGKTGIKEFAFVCFCWIKRSCNGQAHELAKWACKCSVSHGTLSSLGL
ncbi:hypothetical protein FRX31_023729 [Thalictrum thalictroides]|uniref:RNase H type-1 domain-containing protein n=1 Tax=Thalictrum thalictroides TaxID=46969 RepID=A0A7J6VP55_THATH|nr:hypothetical protein FRX31_023729 [Thalictrum thalictroides]